MGSLVSRRKGTVRVEAKKTSTQVTECGIRESAITENPAEVEANASLMGSRQKPQKAAVTKLNIGDGFMPDQDNYQDQTTTREVASNGSKKRLSLSKVRIRSRSGKKNHTHEINSSTQPDLFGVPGRVQLPVENSDGDSKSQQFQTDGIKDEDALAAVGTARDTSYQENLKFSRNVVDEVAKSCANLQPRDYETPAGSCGGKKVKSVTPVKAAGPQSQQTSDSVKNTGSMHRGRPGETKQSSHSSDMSDSKLRSPGMPQRKIVDDKAAGEPPKAIETDDGQKPMLESLEDIFKKNVPCRAELIEVAAVTGISSAGQSLSVPAGLQASCNQPLTTEWTGSRVLCTERNQTDTRNTNSVPVVESHRGRFSDVPINESQTKDGKEYENDNHRCLEEVPDEGEAVETDVCQDEDISEDKLDWNVDDRVRSPSDPEKEDDTDSDSCQEVIAEGFDHDNDDGQEDVMVEGYCSDKGACQEEDMVEDTLDTNVDDRVNSPSDARSDDHRTSDEDEDDTIDVMMNCAMAGEATLVSQPQNSLTTLKDGNSANGSIYSPPFKSPSQKRKQFTEKENTVFKDKAHKEPNQYQGKKRSMAEPVSLTVTPKGTITKRCCTKKNTQTGYVCYSPGCTTEHRERAMSMGKENEPGNTSQENIQSDSKDSAPLQETSIRIHDLSEGTARLELQTGNTEALAAGICQTTAQSCNKGYIPQKETSDIPNTSEDIAKAQKHDNKAGKLLMNVGDRTLHFGADESSKTILEMQEAEAMTLLLLTGALPCENNGDVIRGAGDGCSLDANEVDILDENQDADERAGLAAMLDNNSKSSCQLEQLQVEHSQVGNPHNFVNVQPPQNSPTAGNNASADSQVENLHNFVNVQPPQNSPIAGNNASANSQVENLHNFVNVPPPQNSPIAGSDASAACPPAETHPQVSLNQESSARGNNIPVRSQHIIYGSAAASFVEERTGNELPFIQRLTNPGAAAASEGDWESIPPNHMHGQSNLGELADCASSASSGFCVNCTQETSADAQHLAFGHGSESNTLVIEVQTAGTTRTLAQSATTRTVVQSLPDVIQSVPDEPLIQHDNIGQASNTMSQGQPEQNRLFSDLGVYKAQDTEKCEILECASDEMNPNVQESNERRGTANSPRQRRTVVPERLQVSSVGITPDQSQVTSNQLTEFSTSNVYPTPLQNDKANQE